MQSTLCSETLIIFLIGDREREKERIYVCVPQFPEGILPFQNRNFFPLHTVRPTRDLSAKEKQRKNVLPASSCVEATIPNTLAKRLQRWTASRFVEWMLRRTQKSETTGYCDGILISFKFDPIFSPLGEMKRDGGLTIA